MNSSFLYHAWGLYDHKCSGIENGYVLIGIDDHGTIKGTTIDKLTCHSNSFNSIISLPSSEYV